MTKQFEIDRSQSVSDGLNSPELTQEYARFVRWQEREKLARTVRVLDLAPPFHPVTNFRFFGIVGAWMEEDVIGASVANAFYQGCEKVFLVDNDSSDQTVVHAVSAGATLAHSYRTNSYEEPLRIALMNAVMEDVTEREGAAHTWWLWFDADEFPHGPEGKPLKQYLESLDARYRVVGARYFHHFPVGPPQYVPPYHPLQFQPLCYEQRLGGCKHRKHPLIRLDRGRPAVTMREGFHRYDSLEILFEPSCPAFIHHFPFRAPEVTRRRLTALCGVNSEATSRIQQQDHHEISHYGAPSHSSQRFELLDAVYTGNWDLVVQKMPGRRSNDVILQNWTEVFDGRSVGVWYSPDELSQATQRWEANHVGSHESRHAKL